MTTHLNNINQTEMLYHQIYNKTRKNTSSESITTAEKDDVKESLFYLRNTSNNSSNKCKPLLFNGSKAKARTNSQQSRTASSSPSPPSSSSQFFTHFKFQMIFVVLFCGLFTCCIKYANSQETINFYSNGNLF